MIELTDIKGLGPTTKLKLEKSSIFTIEDLLLLYPKSYKIQKLALFKDVKIGQQVSLEVNIVKRPSVFFFRKNLTKLSVMVAVGDYQFKVDIFNRHYLSKQLQTNTHVVIRGSFKENFKVFTANDLVLKKNYIEGIIPEYKLDDINDGRLKKIITYALNNNYTLDEPLPDYLLNTRKIENINQMIRYIHQPKNQAQLQEALYRLKYQELIYFSLRIEMIKNHQNKIQASKKIYDITLVREFIKRIGFDLTQGQKQATNEIFKDLKSNKQMIRLLQGDVGSGKTIVAILAGLAVVSSRHQVAVMAPTLVLSQQHYSVFTQYFKSLNIKVCLLNSEINAKEKEEILNKISSGNIDIVIGTHSLIQEKIKFKNLGLAIIDEQHRFGVQQRKILRNKGYYPDILMMSATPIPRSLAISIFESSDISQIREKPLGRKEIKTKIITYKAIRKVYNLIDQEIAHRHQVYVVCPLIDESEQSNYFSVQEIFQIYKKVFPDYQIDYLHGKMTDKEKLLALKRFKEKQSQILISTTVIEVGVHIDNATTMIIMNANTFGLAQLHQLRGRIGRNDYQAYCCLVVNDDVDDLERLEILEKTDDGFLISEYDLKLRGPGEVFGKTQAGLPNFVFANLIEDKELFNLTQEDAKIIMNKKNEKSKMMKNSVIRTLDSYHLD